MRNETVLSHRFPGHSAPVRSPPRDPEFRASGGTSQASPGRDCSTPGRKLKFKSFHSQNHSRQHRGNGELPHGVWGSPEGCLTTLCSSTHRRLSLCWNILHSDAPTTRPPYLLQKQLSKSLGPYSLSPYSSHEPPVSTVHWKCGSFKWGPAVSVKRTPDFANFIQKMNVTYLVDNFNMLVS